MPLGFFSKTLQPAERRYSTFGRELLACYLSVKHFQHFAEGHHITVFTDHKPLISATQHHSSRYTDRETRQLDYLSQFDLEFRHIRGSENVVADALSRVPINSLQLKPALDLKHMAAEQKKCGLRKSGSDSHLIESPLDTTGATILCDISTDKTRPIVSESLRRQVFDSIHSLSHPGVQASIKLIADRYTWSGMKMDICDWVRTCTLCQKAKVQRHNRSPIGTFKTPDARFSHVHLDLVGPLPPSHGYSYLLTCIDRFTRWPEAIPLPDTTAENVVRTVLLNWVAKFGAPKTVTTDRGVQFESSLFKSTIEFLGCERQRTTAYHPASNGLVERFHRQLKTSLIARNSSADWIDHLPLVLLGIRTTVKSDLDACPAELVYGSSLRLPGEMISVYSESHPDDTNSLIRCLRQRMYGLQATPTRTLLLGVWGHKLQSVQQSRVESPSTNNMKMI